MDLFFKHINTITKKAKHSVLYRGAIEWNKVDADVRNMSLE